VHHPQEKRSTLNFSALFTYEISNMHTTCERNCATANFSMFEQFSGEKLTRKFNSWLERELENEEEEYNSANWVLCALTCDVMWMIRKKIIFVFSNKFSNSFSAASYDFLARSENFHFKITTGAASLNLSLSTSILFYVFSGLRCENFIFHASLVRSRFLQKLVMVKGILIFLLLSTKLKFIMSIMRKFSDAW
jgi:hypothetical protein